MARHHRHFPALSLLILPALCACQHHPGLRTVVTREYARKKIAKAERLIGVNELAEARRYLVEAIALDPKISSAHSNLAIIAEKEGNLSRAVDHRRTAFKLNPDSFDEAFVLAETEYRLALTSLDRKRLLFAAARTYRHAQSLDPTNPAPTLRLAACYREQGEIGLALDTLKETYRQNPTLPEIQRELGSIYVALEKFDDAAEFYRAALKSNPDDLTTLNGLANIEMVQLEKEGGHKAAFIRSHAIKHLRRSLEINPHQPEIQAHLKRLTPYEWRSVRVREVE